MFSKDNRECEQTPKNIGCCSLYWLPAGELCDRYTSDTGGGILMKSCSNCWYFRNRKEKYKPINI